jgi:hypothetical protein
VILFGALSYGPLLRDTRRCSSPRLSPRSGLQGIRRERRRKGGLHEQIHSFLWCLLISNSAATRLLVCPERKRSGRPLQEARVPPWTCKLVGRSLPGTTIAEQERRGRSQNGVGIRTGASGDDVATRWEAERASTGGRWLPVEADRRSQPPKKGNTCVHHS